ncbi:PREDICTED: uncharacterized protein LOC104698806 [Camelina sativa]|uniref:Uncharacterized protein LOC104698806 n=1 Tax=Camelina sativa TaxID=90675 RepID=A0ABM0SKK0_CAMSA|nr:PREDICTED: uncharacterized protein LOC104698806 [Camelina sativa]
MDQITREKSEDKHVKKKAKLEWKPWDCAKPIGEVIKRTGGREKITCHYETFEFHGTRYGLQDTVLLAPEISNQNYYVAIIKDIYVKEKDGLVKLEVQWFYRREDIKIKQVGKWESENSREIFFSFHRDEVFAESVKHKCLVYFVPDDKQISNYSEHPDFIVRKVYDGINSKLRKFSDKGFNVRQKVEINILVENTISRIAHLLDNNNNFQMTKISRRKRSVRKRCVSSKTEIESSGNNAEVNPVSEKLESLPSSDFDRDKKMVELLEALLQHICCASKEKQAGDVEFLSPDNVIVVVFALEEALYDSFGEDTPMYKYKLELLVEKLKNSPVLARRLLRGGLKPEQVINMKGYELSLADFEPNLE